LLDEDIAKMSQKPLQPTQYVPPPPRREGVTQKLGRWANWLLRFVPEPVKRPINSAFDTFKKNVMSLFPKQQLKFEESKKSALKGFTTHHTIKAPKNQKFDPKTFLLAVRQKALEKFKPLTKVRLVLRTRMERILPTADAQSITEVRNFQTKQRLSSRRPTWTNCG